MKRRLLDRIHDRAWREAGEFLSSRRDREVVAETVDQSSSISANMPWVTVCADFADGKLGSHNFRRNPSVRDIVETVGATDGRFYAARIREWDAGWLANRSVLAIDAWGNPIRWPGVLLGTSRAFSPTTLRYLATALWLRRSGYLEKGSQVVEIGVGFGGLAAMNALVSEAVTTLVDLPQVERSAMRMLTDNGLGDYARLGADHPGSDSRLVISNYAFTELNADLQKEYFDKYLKHSPHGVIISNSAVFADSIQGLPDGELVAWFQAEGLAAKLESNNDLLSPCDHLSGVNLIHW
ncbi:MAG: hypothetical protein V4819_10650 [Verrucomicrobiota bacterium]